MVLVAALALAGCMRGGDDAPPTSATGDPASPTSSSAPLRFGGAVTDAITGERIANATVRIDLAQTLPCGRQGVGWSSYDPPFANGTFGPLEIPRPKSSDVAFFVHASAPGYSENSTFIGPAQARAGVGSLALRLHPSAEVNGTAQPGTLVALDAPIFPRVALVSANGTFSFSKARAVDALFVAGTDVPYRALVRAPAQVDVPRIEARGWTLEGTIKGPTGAPLAADVIAWNGSALWSVGRAGDNGAFSLPLAPQAVALRIDARTPDNHYGGSLSVEIDGPPALKETILLKSLC